MKIPNLSCDLGFKPVNLIKPDPKFVILSDICPDWIESKKIIHTKYTQSGGVRPFGISTLIIGFDANDETPRLYQTDPSGIYSAWKTVREFLEKNYKEGLTKDETIKLTVKSLLEVVQTGAKNIEIALMTADSVIKVRKVYTRAST
ncbi:12059_t:CDS:2, partial [Racocetra fulgida]